MTPVTSVAWFRRDLRLHDHPALAAALERSDIVVPLFILDPRLILGRAASPNRAWFLLGSIADLRTSLRALGSDLVVRVGDPRQLVPDFARGIGAAQVVVSRDHGPYGRARDRVVATRLAAAGIGWREFAGVLVHEPEAVTTRAGAPFRVFTPFHRAWQRLDRRPLVGAPTGVPRLPSALAADVGSIPTLADIGLGDGPTAMTSALPSPGESAARGRLDRWLADGLAGYAATRDRLDIDGTSRLSADLHLGTLSPLEAIERSTDVGDDAGWSSADHAGRRAFVRQLVWREFYAHLLFHEPRLRDRTLHPEFDDLPWTSGAAGDAALAAWQAGRTGYPIVDAAMRQLAATGWMPNRARMLAASFLAKDLLLDWRAGEAWFLRHLVDGDVSANDGGWRWSASTGADPQPWFRIFNPVIQGRRHDPDGDYVRRWVPELRGLPTGRIHAPWEATAQEQAEAGCRIGTDFPRPMVDHAVARRRALAVYGAARRSS